VDTDGLPSFRIDGQQREIGSQWPMALLLSLSQVQVSAPDRFGAVHVDPPLAYCHKP
jgi:hypothetical protein